MQVREFKSGTFYNGDCFEVMSTLPDKSVDMVLADLPYGTTACKWDTVLPFDKIWEAYNRLSKERVAQVLTASQPFTSSLVMSNVKNFRYSWVWEKEQGVNFMLSKKQPMKVHEDILVFGVESPHYFPLMENGKPYISGKGNSGDVTGRIKKIQTINSGTRYPRSIQKINRETGLHPTQKPVALFEYLIKTYTNEGEIVLDNTAGSGTTAIAAMNVGRKWICIEKDETYYQKACERVAKREEELFGQTI